MNPLNRIFRDQSSENWHVMRGLFTDHIFERRIDMVVPKAVALVRDLPKRVQQGEAVGIRRVFGVRYLYFACLTVVIISLLIFNAVSIGSPSLYLVGVLWQVSISFVTFVTLLLNSWREAPAATTIPTPPAD